MWFKNRRAKSKREAKEGKLGSPLAGTLTGAPGLLYPSPGFPTPNPSPTTSAYSGGLQAAKTDAASVAAVRYAGYPAAYNYAVSAATAATAAAAAADDSKQTPTAAPVQAPAATTSHMMMPSSSVAASIAASMMTHVSAPVSLTSQPQQQQHQHDMAPQYASAAEAHAVMAAHLAAAPADMSKPITNDNQGGVNDDDDSGDFSSGESQDSESEATAARIADEMPPLTKAPAVLAMQTPAPPVTS